MIDLALFLFVLALLALGLWRPFVWVLAYLYIDILLPQKIGYVFTPLLPLSLIAFCAAFAGWLLVDSKEGARFTFRQGLIALLLVYCGWTTMGADFPAEAAAKWEWVWKALVFAIFLPLTLTTRLRFEAVTLVMVLAASAIVVNAGIKTATGGGGYGHLYLYVNDNSGIYESSTLSTVAIAIIPLIAWLARHGTVFPPHWRVKAYAAALIFACLLVPIGTESRTGLLCIALLGVLLLRDVKRRVAFLIGGALLALMALPFVPQSYWSRMGTIENHDEDESASTRKAVWQWTMDYAAAHPFGGGFDAYRGNSFTYRLPERRESGGVTTVDTIEVTDKARAYHSAVFEMLGEQGYPGLLLWLWIHLLGLWQMERLRRRWKARSAPGQTWQAPLASALQIAQLVYLLGSLFQGIAYQPFVLLLVGVQCALWSYCRRTDSPRRGRPSRTPPRTAPPRAGDAVAAGAGPLR